MEVLTYMDEDAHMHAFDVSTPTEKMKILASILKVCLENGTIYDEYIEDAKRAIKDKDIDLAIEVI